MRKNRFKMIASVYLIYIRDNKILLLRRENTGYHDGNYVLPAGHVDEGETIPSALIRESREEVGLNLSYSSIELVHIMHRKEEIECMDFFYLGHDTTQTPYNAEPHKSDDVGWFSLDALPNNTIPFIRQAIEQYKQKNLYSEIGW